MPTVTSSGRRNDVTTRTSALPQMPTTNTTGAPKIHSAETRSRPPSSVDEDELTATNGDDDDVVSVPAVASRDSITAVLPTSQQSATERRGADFP